MMVAVIILCCWIVSFFFNGIESGLLSIDPVRLRQNVKNGVPALVNVKTDPNAKATTARFVTY